MKFNVFIFFFCVVCGILHAEEGIALPKEEVEFDCPTDSSNEKGLMPFPFPVEKCIKPNSLTDPSNYSVTVLHGWEHDMFIFAGKYRILRVRCGENDCSYFLTKNVANGKQVFMLDMFTNDYPNTKTSDGYSYTTYLNFWPNSRLLVAQYWVEKEKKNLKYGAYEVTKYECRERSFILENEKLKPISKTRKFCTQWPFNGVLP